MPLLGALDWFLLGVGSGVIVLFVTFIFGVGLMGAER